MISTIINKAIKSKVFLPLLLVLYAMFLCALIAKGTNFNSAPDELMRYDISQYVYENTSIPAGCDESVRNPIWGFSYAFYPITSYTLSGLAMKVQSLFSTSEFDLLFAARMVDVVFIGLYAFICTKISKILFDERKYRILFCSLSVLIPGLLYLGGFVNNDSISLLATSLILYSWLLGIKSKWSYKSVIMLGISIGICFLSYYNAYGFILASVVLYFGSSIIEKKKLKEFLTKGIVIALIAFLLSGWWFIRNAVIYNGDFLGLNASRECGEKYAMEQLKPSNRGTPFKQNQNIFDMLVKDRWIITTAKSFFGTFGYMDINMYDSMYGFYKLILGVGVFGLVLKFIDYMKKKYVTLEKKKEKFKSKSIEEKEKIFLNIVFIFTMIVTVGISIYYSYFNDFQPQGRYIITIMPIVMYYLTIGIKKVLELFFNEKQTNVVLFLLIALIAYLPLKVILIIIVPIL